VFRGAKHVVNLKGIVLPDHSTLLKRTGGGHNETTDSAVLF
jgi:hypothetical protein